MASASSLALRSGALSIHRTDPRVDSKTCLQYAIIAHLIEWKMLAAGVFNLNALRSFLSVFLSGPNGTPFVVPQV